MTWLHTLLPGSVLDHPQFAASVYCHEPCRDANGAVVDLKPVEGVVREVSTCWVLLEVHTYSFFVCALSLCESRPEVGARVRITPYARRRFDGTRCDQPTAAEAARPDWRPDYRSLLPRDSQVQACPPLQRLLDRLETTLAPDGIRTLAQMLIDAGTHEARPSFGNAALPVDPQYPPYLTFYTREGPLVRYLRIQCLTRMDGYELALLDDARNVFWRTSEVAADELAENMAKIIGGYNRWRQAQVNVLLSAGSWAEYLTPEWVRRLVS
jgi:hypothetical protein